MATSSTFPLRFTLDKVRPLGQVTIDDTTITLRVDKQTYKWPLNSETVEQLQTPRDERATERRNKLDKLSEQIFPRIVKKDAKYRNHPVIKEWIELEEAWLAACRYVGLPFGNPGVRRARKNLERIGEAERAKAVSEEYSDLSVIRARNMESLALNPDLKKLHAIWWEERKKDEAANKKRDRIIANREKGRFTPEIECEQIPARRTPEERKRRILKLVPTMAATVNGDSEQYLERQREDIAGCHEREKVGLIDVFETETTERRRMNVSFKQAILFLLSHKEDDPRPKIEPDGRFAPNRLSEGLKVLRQREGSRGCPACGSDRKWFHIDGCPDYAAWETKELHRLSRM